MITYNKAVQYASLFVPYEHARDLVHDLYLALIRRKIDLFNTSKRFCYVALYNYNRSAVVGSMEYRHRVFFDSAEDVNIPSYTDPHQLLVAKELEATFSDFLRLKVEGYTQAEIGQKMNVSRRWVNKVTNREINELRNS